MLQQVLYRTSLSFLRTVLENRDNNILLLFANMLAVTVATSAVIGFKLGNTARGSWLVAKLLFRRPPTQSPVKHCDKNILLPSPQRPLPNIQAAELSCPAVDKPQHVEAYSSSKFPIVKTELVQQLNRKALLLKSAASFGCFSSQVLISCVNKDVITIEEGFRVLGLIQADMRVQRADVGLSKPQETSGSLLTQDSLQEQGTQTLVNDNDKNTELARPNILVLPVSQVFKLDPENDLEHFDLPVPESCAPQGDDSEYFDLPVASCTAPPEDDSEYFDLPVPQLVRAPFKAVFHSPQARTKPRRMRALRPVPCAIEASLLEL